MNDAKLLELVAKTDAYASHTSLPASTWSREDALREIERRMGMKTSDQIRKQTPAGVTEEIEPTTGSTADKRIEKTAKKPRWSGALVGASVFAVIVVIGVVAAVVNSIGDDSETLLPAGEQTFATADASAVFDSYFKAYNAGDPVALMALFTPGATFWSRFQDESLLTELTRMDEEMYLAFVTTEGQSLTSPNCTASQGEPGGAATVVCELGTHDGIAQAIGAPPVTTTATLTVTPDGISRIESVYGEPDFSHVNNAFRRFMQNNHPEAVEEVSFGAWTSVEEAEQIGLATAQYADEWAAFLVAQDCQYPDLCFSRVP